MFYLLPLTGYCFSSANINLAGRELTSGLAKGMLLVFTKYNEPSSLIINKRFKFIDIVFKIYFFYEYAIFTSSFHLKMVKITTVSKIKHLTINYFYFFFIDKF